MMPRRARHRSGSTQAPSCDSTLARRLVAALSWLAASWKRLAALILPPRVRFQGEGTVEGNVANSGFVVPEDSTGVLHVQGNYTQTSSRRLNIFADLFLPPGSNSRLDVTGEVALNGTLQMNLAGMGQFRGTRSFDVLDWTGNLSGTFSTLQLPMFGGAFAWDTSQLYISGVLILTGPPLEGDYNNDGTVNAATTPCGATTWATLRNRALTTPATDSTASTRPTSHGGSNTTVIRRLAAARAQCVCRCPESATLLMLMVGILLICTRRRTMAS